MHDIVQVFSGTPQEQRYIDWWLAAMANPKVRPRLTISNYFTRPELAVNDWDSSTWMCGSTVLTLHYDRPRSSASVSLFSLGGESGTFEVLRLLRFLYAIAHTKASILEFVVAESNVIWLNRLDKLLGRFDLKYGIKPKGAFNNSTGAWESLHLYQVSVAALPNLRPLIRTTSEHYRGI